MPFFKPENLSEGFIDKMKSNLQQMKAAGPSGIAKAYVNAGKRLLGGNKPRETVTKKEISYDNLPDFMKQKYNPDGSLK